MLITKIIFVLIGYALYFKAGLSADGYSSSITASKASAFIWLSVSALLH